MLDYYDVGDALLVEDLVVDESGGSVLTCDPMLSRTMRADPRVRARARPVSRGVAESVYRQLGAGELPDEATLRAHLTEGIVLGGRPLSLGTGSVPVYRILLSGDAGGLARPWGMGSGDRPGVVGTVSRVGYTVDLRRIGGGTAWAVDVTGPGAAPLVRTLVTEVRGYGLIPVTVERLR